MALVETTSGGWGEGRGAAPQSDWKPQRIGAAFPDSLRALRGDAEACILAACGVPVELITARSDGAAVAKDGEDSRIRRWGRSASMSRRNWERS